MSSFAALSVALSALQAQRRAMDITGQNVANANTAGYTRQRADMQALGPNSAPTLNGSGRIVGDGVLVDQIVRLADVFAAARLRSEESTAGYLSTRSELLQQVESRFMEPGDDGLSAQLGDLWAAWGDVSNNPDDLGARKVLLQQTNTVIGQIRSGYEAVATQWDQTKQQVGALADDVNGLASAIADLNASIRSAHQMGTPANELMDSRDQLVLQVSQLIGATTRESEHGMVDVLLGGTALVRGANAAQISTVGSTTLEGAGVAPVGLTWPGGNPVSVQGGQVGALLEALSDVLPDAAAGYDAVAAALATGVNALHETGHGLDGVTGRPFFTGTTAVTIALASTDPRHVAAAAPGAGELDGSMADDIAAVGTEDDGPDSVWQRFVVDVGVQSQAAQRRASTAEVVRRDAETALVSATGVDIDEEMTKLVAYQRAYEGAARVLTAVDQALDTLINRTGVVGR